jgi:hypothetical protein
MTAATPIGAPLPASRGPISAALLAALGRPPHQVAPVPTAAAVMADDDDDFEDEEAEEADADGQ